MRADDADRSGGDVFGGEHKKADREHADPSVVLRVELNGVMAFDRTEPPSVFVWGTISSVCRRDARSSIRIGLIRIDY